MRHRHSRPHLASEQLIERHIGQLALDIPERHIDTGNGVIFDWTVTPIGILVHQLPELFNGLRVAPEQQRLEILFKKAFDGQMTISKSRAAQAVQAILIGFNLDDDKIDAFRRGQDNFHIRDERSQ